MRGVFNLIPPLGISSEGASVPASVYFFPRETFTTRPWSIRKKAPVKRKVTRDQLRQKNRAWKWAWSKTPILTREKKTGRDQFLKRHPWTPKISENFHGQLFLQNLFQNKSALQKL